MTELGDSLTRMTFMQLLLLFGFVTCYVLAIGGLLGAGARWRFALLALGLAIGFAALTRPWVHGALLVAFVVAGLGLFVLLSWLLAQWFGPRTQPAQPPIAAEPAPPQQVAVPAPADSHAAVHGLPAQARTMR